MPHHASNKAHLKERVLLSALASTHTPAGPSGKAAGTGMGKKKEAEEQGQGESTDTQSPAQVLPGWVSGSGSQRGPFPTA